ncbi:TPA: IS3 family transposase [Proteus mirabilis]|nr:IS3 family transposase [Proteus mirabilis]HDS8387759.1 IS3 family transposase [Proteus mirabilis]HDT1685614.1 IS3 family transposase [Proteus mirabilis]
MFSVHRSSYQYWRHRAKTPSAEQIRLRALVREVHKSSRGSVGARTIADIVSKTKQVPLTRYRATKLMKSLGLVSCQMRKHRYTKSTQEHVEIPNHLGRQFAVTEPNQVWVGDVTYSVPGVQGGHGCLNEPRVCLEY